MDDKTNFWLSLQKPFFILAPMEAVTDIVFRHVVLKAARPDVFFTEFTNSDSFVSPKGEHSTRSRLEFSSDEHPIVAQIWGKTPEHFEIMAKNLASRGFKGIDINMGCPDKSVVKGGSGSGLIRTPDLAGEIIASTKKSGLPVSVKTRLGDKNINESPAWIEFLLKQDIANLTIHLRTRKEMSKVPAHFELIEPIVKMRDEVAPHTLITINGDIKDKAHGLELVSEYGVDGIMIGRGIFHNPFAFDETPTEHSKQELIELLKYHLDVYDQFDNENTPKKFDPLKRFFKIYINGFENASDIREKLMHAKTTDEARKIISLIE